MARPVNLTYPGYAVPKRGVSREPVVVWRTWLVLPDGARDGRPMLTGLFGFPWREAHLDAKCMVQEPATQELRLGATIDRHHRIVPEPWCTCGIYATREQPGLPPRYLIPRRQPLVSGFVQLSGRVLVDRHHYRAQRATIVGPLTLVPPRSSRMASAASWLGVESAFHAVVTEPRRYRFTRAAARRSVPVTQWRELVGAALQRRYGVAVMGFDSP